MKKIVVGLLAAAALTACGGQVTPNPAGTYTPPATTAIGNAVTDAGTTIASTAAEAGAGTTPGTYNARGNRAAGLNNFVEWRSATATPLKITVAKIEPLKSCKYGDPGYYLTTEVVLETADDPDGALSLFSLYGDWETVAPDGRSTPGSVTICGGDDSSWLRNPAPNRKYDYKIHLRFAEQPPAGSVLVFRPSGDDHGVEWPI